MKLIKTKNTFTVYAQVYEHLFHRLFINCNFVKYYMEIGQHSAIIFTVSTIITNKKSFLFLEKVNRIGIRCYA